MVLLLSLKFAPILLQNIDRNDEFKDWNGNRDGGDPSRNSFSENSSRSIRFSDPQCGEIRDFAPFHVMQAATAPAHFFAGQHEEASSWAERPCVSSRTTWMSSVYLQ